MLRRGPSMRSVISPATPLILGSASPRRREILSHLGVPIRVAPADVPEGVEPGELPARYIERIVRDKLRAVFERLGSEMSESPALFSGVLVADTIVVLGERILGKPSDTAEAVKLLTALCGREHRVFTRYALSRVSPSGSSAPLVERSVESKVWLRSASAVEIERYAATGEGLDKAGAYAVQGVGAFLVQRIDGSYSNVVGLPACEVVEDLLASGLLERFP
jgi:septum formation protein